MEQTPSLPGNNPELPVVSPPSGGELGNSLRPEMAPEKREQPTFNNPADHIAAPQVAMPSMPVPVVVADDSATQSAVTVMSPALAADDDLIEKEWVDKAKKVLAETKDDPYRREQEVGRLQADYLEKRYGRRLGTSQ